jgi:hypothetical protein
MAAVRRNPVDKAVIRDAIMGKADSMRRFVPGGLGSLGNQISVPIRPDKDG